MIKRIIGALFLSAFFMGNSLAHSGKPKYHIIIDTDGAIDDMRAITMLLSGNDIRVLALTCSQGTLLPETVYSKVNSLLSTLHHEGIPVGVGDEINTPLPLWASFNQDIQWGREGNFRQTGDHEKSVAILGSSIENYQDKVTLIALGSLKTYADWLKENIKAADKIERIIWYNDLNIENGFNYQVSPESFEFIKQIGIRLDIVANGNDQLLVEKDYLDKIHSTLSIYGSTIDNVHSGSSVVKKINAGHLQLWDDIVPLYLTLPVLFEIETSHNVRYVSINPHIPPGLIYETIGQLLISSTVTNNRVFKSFPIDTSLYKPGYARMLNETLRKFGSVEWKAICMTNEIHGHTGIYSIIGAKMGIRAMEYFNVGVNNLQVVTFAGKAPPLSCFNDGVQISSGATIGQGLISVSDSISPIPSAIFEFNNQRVHIALNPELAGQMEDEIKYGVTNYGLLTDKYWLYIEGLAMKYWADFNRHEIFLIEKL